MFEISFVDHDDPFYQVHNLPAYKLKVKTFEYSSEDIDTGIAEIDAIETANSLDMLEYQFTLEQSGAFNQQMQLEDGTLLMQENGTTGAGLGDNILGEDETGGEKVLLETLAGTHYIIQESYVVDTIDENSQSDYFDSADDNVLDFSEKNPFGDIG